jgi:hypothetical protein
VRHRRLRGDQGQVGGIEVIPFGILTFVIAMLVIANAWAVVDAKLSTTSAAREAVRTFVEAPNEETALFRAESAAQQAISGHGRSAGATSISISSAASVKDSLQSHRQVKSLIRFEAGYQETPNAESFSPTVTG